MYQVSIINSELEMREKTKIRSLTEFGMKKKQKSKMNRSSIVASAGRFI